MEGLQLLSRSEMRNIKGGNTGCSGQCLYCHTPNGFEAWYRPNDDPSGDADGECGQIYPAYGGGNGEYFDCGAHLAHQVVANVNC